MVMFLQTITHLALGVLIQKIIENKVQYPILGISLIVILAFLSHIILDAVAKITFHPEKPKKTFFGKFIIS